MNDDNLRGLMDAAVDATDTRRPPRNAPARRGWAYWLELLATALAVLAALTP